jgi:uncharacterized membrane protein YedE/YeeE
MKRNSFCIFRLFASLVLVALVGSQTGGIRFMAQQIEMIGPRQWLGLMAGAVVANTPIIAPVSRRIASGFNRRATVVTASMATDEEGAGDDMVISKAA